jgi:hypothetical protein
MTEPLTITVAFDVGRLTPNRVNRMVWQQRRNVAMVAKVAAGKAWREAGCPVLNVPVRVDLTIRRARRLDPHACIGGYKWVEDGLFVGRITPDDSDHWITYGEIRQEIARCWKGREEVVVTVFPRPPAAAAEGGCAAAMEIEEEKTRQDRPFAGEEAGWAIPAGARSAHYWSRRSRAGWSACGRWQYGYRLRNRGDLEPQAKCCKVCSGYAPQEPR